MNTEEMICRFSDRQDALFKKLYSNMKIVDCFEYEGVIFKGNAADAAINFAHNNPTGGDFFVWLQDHYRQLHE